MSDISRATLFGKLDAQLYEALEQATGFCKLRGNPYVELAHWLNRLFEQPDNDLRRIVEHFDIAPDRLTRDILAALDALPRGAGSVTDFSAHIDEAVERAWLYATLKYGAARIRGAALLLGIVKTPTLRNVLHGISREFQRIMPDTLADELERIVAGSPEDAQTLHETSAVTASDAAVSGDSALARYGVDLTARARAGEIDPVTGRDDEIRQLIDILLRRRQNNPLLTGEAGVGKTAVVEGFALRVANGDVPPALADIRLVLLDIGLLQAGASVRGEFEARLRQVIDEVTSSAQPIVLFIDEVHVLVGAGGSAGTGDAANLLKPALARGLLRTIGATTWTEYKKYIEKDPALSRRFEVVQVHEPDEARALGMLRGLAGKLEQHHGVLVLDEALTAAVTLSHRFIPARQLPDKAVGLLDTACARVAVSQHGVPAAIDDARHRIEALDTERALTERECMLGGAERAQLDVIDEAMATQRAELESLEARWRAERELIERIGALRKQLVERASDRPDEVQLAELDGLLESLSALQGEKPLVLHAVDAQAVASVVADWTGIPVGRMLKDEAEAVLNLTGTLATRVLGQPFALETIANRIQTARARLVDPGKPVGVFLLCGPSGVGKTETALTLAETLYGGERNLISINMSEFQEAHTVSSLKGAPPGYVGYGEGGVLTEAVRRRPYSVVLLDEIEKAHADVHEMFFQVFDKGWMEDGEGRYINFRNTVIILTSNVGSELIARACRDATELPEPIELVEMLHAALLRVFPAALIGRLTIVPYYPLSDAMLARIVELQFERIRARVDAHHGAALSYDDDAVRLILERANATESGARVIDAILTNTVLPRISRELLGAAQGARRISAIRVGARDGDFVFDFDN
ncbi:type VI secretion system ATPase TssH [Trinickia fusca]|uniref:Type VI secretion system ATPase TssH n=1 Tax=Trinickia fusca TaxID=2419777 RepID=A0A494X2H0_9BURK|nr:type VI secretion system ATPase TssH [Trinickia fusca]RKP44530.1 type VI secretion system ATPase TssH [Trinickia fusca]